MSTVQTSSTRLFWLIVLSLILPPVAVALEFGVFTMITLVNLLISLLLPFFGFIHAVYYLTQARYKDAPSRQGYEAVSSGEEGHQAPSGTNTSNNNSNQPTHSCCSHQPQPQSSRLSASSSGPQFEHLSSESVPQSNPPPYELCSGAPASLDNKIQRSYGRN